MSQTININNSAVNIESLHDDAKAPQERLSSAIVMIEAMNGEVSELKVELANMKGTVQFMQQLIKCNNHSTTKKGRVAVRCQENVSVLRSMRDVMIQHVFPWCKFIGKQHLMQVGKGTISEKIMKELKIKEEEKMNWWGENYELAEKLMVEHKTQATQKLKKKYMKGMCRILL